MFDNENIKTGVYNISIEEYHKSKGLSRSTLCELKKSPYHFWHRYLSNEYIEKPKEAFIMGQSIHVLLLEPELFDTQFIVKPKIEKLPECGLLRDLGREEFDRQKAERENQQLINKQILDEFEIASQGKTIVTKDQYEDLLLMVKSIHRHPQAPLILKGGQIEQSFYWTDPDTGFLCKARPDLFHDNMVVDLKSSRDAAPWRFKSDLYKGGYHIQAGMCAEAFWHIFKKKLENYIFVVVENTRPFCSAVYQLDESAIDKGRDEFKDLLFKYRDCLQNNDWPMYPTQVVSLPAYANYEE